MTATAAQLTQVTVSVLMVVRGEPIDRIRRAVSALATQVGTDPFELVIAAPPVELGVLAKICPSGSIARIVLVSNERGDRSPGLNAAASAACGTFAIRVDARSLVPEDYVARCVARLEQEPGIGVVGGVQWPLPGNRTLQARGIARALRNPWLLGGAAYRRPGASGAVDTVYLGAFRRDELLEVGAYDERLLANEDFDLCRRYESAGLTVWLEEGLVVGYEARIRSKELLGQYQQFGISKVRFWRETGERPSRRQRLALAGAAVGVTAFSASFVRPRLAATLMAVGALAVIACDKVAHDDPENLGVRVHACVSSVAVLAGWCSGVVREGVAGTRRRNH